MFGGGRPVRWSVGLSRRAPVDALQKLPKTWGGVQSRCLNFWFPKCGWQLYLPAPQQWGARSSPLRQIELTTIATSFSTVVSNPFVSLFVYPSYAAEAIAEIGLHLRLGGSFILKTLFDTVDFPVEISQNSSRQAIKAASTSTP
jgi:hypothetical protein